MLEENKSIEDIIKNSQSNDTSKVKSQDNGTETKDSTKVKSNTLEKKDTKDKKDIKKDGETDKNKKSTQ